MAFQRTVLTDFTAGELSGKFAGRFDLPVYQKGCQSLVNWVPFTQGGTRTRAGLKYLGVTEGNAKARLIPFAVHEANPFVLEFTNNLIRIWKSGVLVGAPTEVVTTYTLAELFQIQYVQVYNELYLVHHAHPIAVFKWTGTTNFSISNLTISFATDVSAWVAATAYAVDDIVYNDTPQKIYRCITAGTSAGSGGPTGEADDITDNTVHWTWEITKPFSAASDYPVAIAHFNGRMWFGGTINHPSTIWASQPFFYGDFNYFNLVTYTVTQLKDYSTWANPLVPETEEISYTRSVFGEGGAFHFEMASDMDEDIYWMTGADALVVGTCSSEWVIPESVNALDIHGKIRSRIGSAFIQGTVFQDSPVFAQGTLSKALIREYAYLAQSSALQSPDLTFGADHMLENGIEQIAIASMPQPTMYCITNGELACLLYNKQYNVLAWYHIETEGDTIESVAVVPGTTDNEVYVSVSRASGRTVEKFDLLWDTSDIPLDSYVDIASIAGATQGGLARFNGQTVTIFNITDSTVHTAAVAGGSLTYPAGDGVGDHVVIGMLVTCAGQTMRLNNMTQTGSGQGQLKRMIAVTARVLSSMPFKAGYSNTAASLETATKRDETAWTAAYTGDVYIPFQGEWDRDGWVWFVQDAPYRTTILCLMPEIDS